MMTLTRLQLNLQRRQTLMALANPNRFHGAITQAKEGTQSKVLWRVEQLHDKWYLLILHGQPLNLHLLQEQFGFSDIPAQSKDYNALLDRIDLNQKWQFKLVAAPMFSSKCEPGEKRGKKQIHRTITVQKMWLEEKAKSCGFELDWFDVIRSQPISIKKGKEKRSFSFYAVTYEGILSVENPDLLKEALMNGIGREKAYGMGLMTLIPVQSAS